MDINTSRLHTVIVSFYCSMMLFSSYLAGSSKNSLAGLDGTNILANVERTATALIGPHITVVPSVSKVKGVKISDLQHVQYDQSLTDTDALPAIANAVPKHFNKEEIKIENGPLSPKIAAHFNLIGEKNIVSKENIQSFQVSGNTALNGANPEFVQVGQQDTKEGKHILIFSRGVVQAGVKQLQICLMFVPGGFQKATTMSHGQFTQDITNLDDDPQLKEFVSSSLQFWKQQLSQSTSNGNGPI